MKQYFLCLGSIIVKRRPRKRSPNIYLLLLKISLLASRGNSFQGIACLKTFLLFSVTLFIFLPSLMNFFHMKIAGFFSVSFVCVCDLLFKMVRF